MLYAHPRDAASLALAGRMKGLLLALRGVMRAAAGGREATSASLEWARTLHLPGDEEDAEMNDGGRGLKAGFVGVEDGAVMAVVLPSEAGLSDRAAEAVARELAARMTFAHGPIEAWLPALRADRDARDEAKRAAASSTTAAAPDTRWNTARPREEADASSLASLDASASRIVARLAPDRAGEENEASPASPASSTPSHAWPRALFLLAVADAVEADVATASEGARDRPTEDGDHSVAARAALRRALCAAETATAPAADRILGRAMFADHKRGVIFRAGGVLAVSHVSPRGTRAVAGHCDTWGLFGRTEDHPRLVKAWACWVGRDEGDGEAVPPRWASEDEEDFWGGDEEGGGDEGGEWRVLLTVGIGADLMCLTLAPLRGDGSFEAATEAAAAAERGGAATEIGAALGALTRLRAGGGTAEGAALDAASDADRAERSRLVHAQHPPVLYHYAAVSGLEGIVVTPPAEDTALGAGGGGGGNAWDAPRLAEDFFATAAFLRATLRRLGRAAEERAEEGKGEKKKQRSLGRVWGASECSARLVPRSGAASSGEPPSFDPPPPFWVTARVDALSGREWYVCHHEAVPSAYVERAFGVGFGGVFG